MNLREVFALLALALVAPACATYKVVTRSGPPSALAEADEISIGFDYTEVRMGVIKDESEAEFQAGKDPAKFESVKRKMDLEFATGFAEFSDGKVVDSAPTQLTVVYTQILQGKFVPPVFEQDTVVRVRCVFASGGTVTDEIETWAKVAATVTRPAIIQRVGVAAKMLARRCAHYYNKSREA